MSFCTLLPPPWRKKGVLGTAGSGVLRTAYFVLFLLALMLPVRAEGQLLLTQQEALRLAFPEPARIERRTAFLEPARVADARRLAGGGTKVEKGVVTYYVGTREGRPLGVAYFDVHRVRTLPEVVMIVVSPEARVERIEILKFSEPPQYLAPEGWLEQFEGEGLSDRVSLRRGIANITGATLTAEAVTDAVRRVLALHQVIRPFARPALTTNP